MWNRYHQKVCLVDDTSFLGSYNISKQYSGLRYGFQDFRDFNVILRKTCALDIIQMFLDILNLHTVELTKKAKNIS